jgi:aspartyl-tRNA(Asn)/glutamyl-tRNA(Gln) amidotransferase subunit A
VVGLKPTFGRVSKAGVVPVSWSFDHVGPIARTVEDAALLLGAIAGYDPADYATVPVPVPDYTAGLALGVQGLRIGIPRPHFFDLLDAEVRAAVEAALVVLKDLGAELRDIELPLTASGTAGRGLVDMTEARLYHDATLRTRPHDLGADVLALLSRDLPDGQALVAGLRACRALAEQMRARLEEVDVLATPTVPVVAPRIGETTLTVDGQRIALLAALLRCVSPFSATHLPALSVPCGFTAAGLPIGLQIAGRPFGEATVLRIGHAYEQATEWHLRHPAWLEH